MRGIPIHVLKPYWNFAGNVLRGVQRQVHAIDVPVRDAALGVVRVPIHQHPRDEVRVQEASRVISRGPVLGVHIAGPGQAGVIDGCHNACRTVSVPPVDVPEPAGVAELVRKRAGRRIVHGDTDTVHTIEACGICNAVHEKHLKPWRLVGDNAHFVVRCG